MSPEDAARDLYGRIIAGWNAGDARAMAAPMAPDALMIGFDGSQLQGRDEIEAELGRIFARPDSNGWFVALFQTTPAQLHGRDDLREALTEELSKELAQQP